MDVCVFHLWADCYRLSSGFLTGIALQMSGTLRPGSEKEMNIAIDHGLGWLMVGVLLSTLGAPIAAGQTRSDAGAWYLSAGAIHRVTLKPTTKYWKFDHLAIDPAKARMQMIQWRSEGISALEIFAPEEGGNSYDGLDAKDRLRIDPDVGTMGDFKRLVALAHSLGLRVVTFQNLGYSSTESSQFKRAENAVKTGKTTRQTGMFFWSKRADAPAPAHGNRYFLIRPDLPGYQPDKAEFWQWSDVARAYYWTRWPGKDAGGNTIHLPQYNWSGDAWPDEAGRVVRFWMNTGLDGMVLDAVNWYAGATWAKINRYITGVIASYGEEFSQPEGGGGFGEDPVAWITEGGFTNVFDYGLGIWWEKNNQPLISSVELSNPGIFEKALRKYHDRVVAFGGTLYVPVPKLDNTSDQIFAEALLATSGDMPCYCNSKPGITDPSDGIPILLKLKTSHPALYQNSLRRRIVTSNPQIYAIERYAANNSERLLLVFNFSRNVSNVTVDVGTIHGATYVDLLSHAREPIARQMMLFSLAPHGYRIFQIQGYISHGDST